MRRGTIFIILFVLVAGAIIAATTLLRSQPALEITIATDPLAEAWLRDAALAYNESGATIGVGRRVRVNIVVRPDIRALDEAWSTQNHPNGWIPAWSSIVSVAQSSSVQSQPIVTSLARSPLVWMSFESHVGEVPDVSWQAIQEVASGPRGNALNLAFTLPTNSVQGFAALISGVAEYHQSGILSSADLQDAEMRAWLAPIVQSVPNFNTIGANVAQFLAGQQGANVDAAIAPESQWLTSLGALTQRGTPRFAYPDYPVVFDFPFVTLRSSTTTDDEIAAAQSFAAWLSSSSQQTRLSRFGLRPATGDPEPTDQPFAQAQAFGITAALPAVQPVQLPVSSSVQALLQWFDSVNR